MKSVTWMTGASLLSWLVVAGIGGDRVNPEALYGMLGPLAAAFVTWLVVEQTWQSSPERLTGVMMVGFAAKLVFFGVYVAVMLRGLSVRPVPFVGVFVSYVIALYAMQALFLKRMTAPR